MRLQQELITALRNSSMWSSAAYIVTYDEHGGYFDHVVPPQLDAYGAGIRVTTWVISPYAKKGQRTDGVLQLLSRTTKTCPGPRRPAQLAGETMGA